MRLCEVWYDPPLQRVDRGLEVGFLGRFVRPLGYLAFLLAVVALRAAARFLGERDELGFFASRLAALVWRYPEVMRRSVRTAWIVWAIALAVALSPIDPLLTVWDEVVLLAGALGVVWQRLVGGRRAAH
jgi:hypothetical protein